MGLSSQLYGQLLHVLSKCDLFESDQSVAAIFIDKKLKSWRYKLKSAYSVQTRIENIIQLLHDKGNEVGRNGLILLLEVLQERTPPEDSCYIQLEHLKENCEREIYTPPVFKPIEQKSNYHAPQLSDSVQFEYIESRQTILIVDDNLVLAETFSEILQEEGYHTHTVFNGREGIQLARRNLPDLILLDINMPRTNGFVVSKRIRRDPLLKNIPIVFISGNVDDEIRRKSLEAGGNWFIMKPFGVKELVLLVDSIFNLTKKSFPRAKKTPTLKVGDVFLNYQLSTVTTPQKKAIKLSDMQFELLYYFMINAKRTVSQKQLLQAILNYYPNINKATLQSNITALRKKLEPNPRCPIYIQTVRGYGYMFTP